jgi:hypothetical protein
MHPQTPDHNCRKKSSDNCKELEVGPSTNKETTHGKWSSEAMKPLQASLREAKFLKDFHQYWQEHAGSKEMKLPLRRMLKAL